MGKARFRAGERPIVSQSIGGNKDKEVFERFDCTRAKARRHLAREGAELLIGRRCLQYRGREVGAPVSHCRRIRLAGQDRVAGSAKLSRTAGRPSSPLSRRSPRFRRSGSTGFNRSACRLLSGRGLPRPSTGAGRTLALSGGRVRGSGGLCLAPRFPLPALG
jgi:hypothetical protein